MGAVIVKSAGTGIHCGGQHEARGKGERHGGARDTDGAILERLSLLQPNPATFRIANLQILYPLTKTSTPKSLSSERLSSLGRNGISANAEKRSASSPMVTEGLATGDISANP
jgi:hypothetical protein